MLIVNSRGLIGGTSRSCGCLKRDVSRATCRSRTHHGHAVGSRVSPEYAIWAAIKGRCLNPRLPGYKWYGARGITVCDRWRDSFESFYADMGAKPSPRHSIDRIDSNGPYEPGNCRWATRREQMNNTSSNHRLTYRGRTQTITEWAREVGLRPCTLHTRIARGWPVGPAIELPLGSKPHRDWLEVRKEA
jgi:hypothetical protein